MPANTFEEYRQLMIQLGYEKELSVEEKKYEEITKAFQRSFDNLHDAADLLTRWGDYPIEKLTSSPIIIEAVKWLDFNLPFAWRILDEAMRNWGPHSGEFQEKLLQEREWRAKIAEMRLQALRSTAQKKQKKGFLSRFFG
jgi:hypothetical protein